MRLLLAFAAALLLSAPVLAQPVLFVDADATGAADGSSWADAFPHLQDALAVAEAGDEVWVAEGTYHPTDGTDRDASFVLVSGVALYGGFDGSETARDERDPTANVTVLSGDLGEEGEIGDNAYHVVVASGVGESTVLDGFTVTGGNGNGANPRNRGGGIYGVDASLVVRNCRIVANQVVQTDGNGGGGGAFFGGSGTPRFERVAFERNGLNALGGGLWMQGDLEREADDDSRSTLEAELVRQERGDARAPSPPRPVWAEGGGVVVLREVAFVENTASFGGGALVALVPGVVFVGVTFERNVAFNARGGLSLDRTAADLVNVGFYGNNIKPEGSFDSSGGMFTFGAIFSLTNAVFVGNSARLSGALGQGGGRSVLTNVTFTANETEDGSAVRLALAADVAGQSAIFWRNSAAEIEALSDDVTLSHVLVEGGCPSEVSCESILDAAPRFLRAPDPGSDGVWGTLDDDYGDLHLQEGSPALDFGLTSFLPPDTFDLDGDGDTAEPLPVDLAGEMRVVGAAVDLGAYERQPPVAADPEPSAPSEVGLDVYPNPARGPVTVSLDLRQPQRVAITVYDLRGRRVAVLHEEPLAGGTHTLRLDTARLPAGVYLVRLRGEAASLTRRFVILR